jgi:hypothetical protein
MVFYACVQRHSQTVIEEREESYGDAEHDLLMGRLEGCDFEGDWWVRIVPLVGQNGRTFEGAVQRSGVFEIPGEFNRGRYALLVGFEREVIRTGGFNLRPVRNLFSVGTISLREGCPQRIGKSK